MQKEGLFSARPAEDTSRTKLTWRVGPAQMRRGTQGHVAEPREPTWRAGGAQEARTRVRGHASPRGHTTSATWQGGWQVKGSRVSGPW